jgi:peptide/nickel transport system permease protein
MGILLQARRLTAEARWGLGILLPILALSVLVPAISPYSALTGTDLTLAPPSLAHPFGTDNLGRDVLVRTFAAAQLDVALALAGVSIPLICGTIVGALVATSRAATVSAIWTMIIEGINAFPFLVLVIGIVAIVGPGAVGVVIALSLTNWARYARIARARALALREADFIAATYVLGYSRSRVLLRHLLPNVYSEALAYGLSDFVIVIITVAGLTFLGLGIRPPAPEWGGMMSDGRLFLTRAWWIPVFPGLALSLTAISVTLLAQGISAQVRGDA